MLRAHYLDHDAQPPPLRPASPGRDVDMKDSWSHGDDRRDRGRVDRGVSRRSPSRERSKFVHDRRPSPVRESRHPRDRTPTKSRTALQSDRPRDRSHERRRRPSRSPLRDVRDDVREKNRGRELLDARGSDKSKRGNTHNSPSTSKRRKTRSPSPPRSHKKSRREASRSPVRVDRGVDRGVERGPPSRSDRKRGSPYSPPPRRRTPDRRPSDSRPAERPRHRDSAIVDRRRRSPSLGSERREAFPKSDNTSRRGRSPLRESYRPRDRSPFDRLKDRPLRRDRSRTPIDKVKAQVQTRERSPLVALRSPGSDRHGSSRRSRQSSPRGPEHPKERRNESPREDRGANSAPRARDEYRPLKATENSGRPAFQTGANSIEVKGPRSSTTASRANSIEGKSDDMNGRGAFYGHQGYNQNSNPMQAAFPLKPQYNQVPQPDPRQYSQSPQHHMTPHSYQGSPQGQSPYGAGRGNWVGQQQYSPQP